MTDFGKRVASAAHASRHESGGADEIDISGLTAADHAARHKSGGADEIDISGLQPADHASLHESGGEDPLDIASLAGDLDHGALAGKDDDDHTQYHIDARGDARYPLIVNKYSNFTAAYAYKTIIQGTYDYYLNTEQIYNYRFSNGSGNINDEIEYEIFAEAGVKTFQLLGTRSGDAAIITVYLDDVSLGTIDQYGVSDLWNITWPLSCTVVGTGVHSLKIKSTSKNGSSSAYWQYLTMMRIY